MTIEEILADIRSDRVKKVIFDCDAYNDIDDEYALAFAVGSDRMDVCAANATLFNNPRVNGHEDGMLHAYDQIVKVLKLIGYEHIPAFKGAPTPVTLAGGPVPNPASDNIIKTAHSSDEPVYILVTGGATNVASAIMTDPSIKDKICVIWMACNTLDYVGPARDYNADQDRDAGHYLIDCGVNLVLIPSIGPEGYGTQTLLGDQEYIDRMLTGDSDAAVFFRNYLPDFAFAEEGEPLHHFWDIAAPGILEDSDAFDIEIISAPRIRSDNSWSLSEDRHKIIYVPRMDDSRVMDETFKTINKLI